LERSVLLADTAALPLRWLQLPRDDGLVDEAFGGDEGSLIRLPLDGSYSLDEMEARIIRTALERNGFNVTATARTLGATRQTLRYRIEKHGIELDTQGGISSGR
ncbi:MAG: helix-turn-helix domain-containing protein, partial [Gemmatimonadota bacterium]